MAIYFWTDHYLCYWLRKKIIDQLKNSNYYYWIWKSFKFEISHSSVKWICSKLLRSGHLRYQIHLKINACKLFIMNINTAWLHRFFYTLQWLNWSHISAQCPLLYPLKRSVNFSDKTQNTGYITCCFTCFLSVFKNSN